MMRKVLIILALVFAVGSLAIISVKSRRTVPHYTEMVDSAYAQTLSTQISEQRRNAIVTASEKVAPAVVSVSVTSIRLVRDEFYDMFFGDFWRDFFPPRYFREEVKSLGSGVIIDKDGLIVTNEHVVHNAQEIKITLPDGRIFDAEVIGVSERLDLALLKIDGKDLPYATLGNSDSVIKGEWAIAIGNPFGYIMEDPDPTITAGVISAVHRTIRGKGNRIYRDMIQTDAAINPGNSGGPLVNALGQVIGINTFIVTPSGGNVGIGFAIPINTVKKAVREILDYGHVREGYLGITVQTMTDELREALDYHRPGGVLVAVIDPRGPAKGKLKEGDIIVAVNGRKLFNEGDWEDVTYALVPDEQLSLWVWRNGSFQEVKVKAVEYKEQKESLPMGITGTTVTPALVMKYGLVAHRGVLVLGVKSGSLAARLGIQPGDVILELNGKHISDTDDLKDAWKSTRKRGILSITIDRYGARISRTIFGF